MQHWTMKEGRREEGERTGGWRVSCGFEEGPSEEEEWRRKRRKQQQRLFFYCAVDGVEDDAAFAAAGLGGRVGFNLVKASLASARTAFAARAASCFASKYGLG